MRAHRAARRGNVAVVQAANGGRVDRCTLHHRCAGHARADDLGGGFAFFGQRLIQPRNLRWVVFGDGFKAGVDDHVDVMRVGRAQPVWAVGFDRRDLLFVAAANELAQPFLGQLGPLGGIVGAQAHAFEMRHQTTSGLFILRPSRCASQCQCGDGGDQVFHQQAFGVGAGAGVFRLAKKMGLSHSDRQRMLKLEIPNGLPASQLGARQPPL